MNHKLARRTLFIGLLLPFLYFGTASATFIYRLHAGNTSRVNVRLPLIPPPDGSRRILVFAPHCDDETLGCGGLLLQAVKAGAEVKIVMITNGDGFRVAVERQFRTLRVEPKDYVQFAAIRQQESYRALKNLGISRSDVVFLGYPDRGLMPLWSDFWSPDRPFTSSYTRASQSPYPAAYHTGATYCGQSLLDDIQDVLKSFHPTDVYVTHPSDDHPDHSAASAFVTLALRRLRAGEREWPKSCALHYYLVHRGDWPAPQGPQKQDMLAPPGEMAKLDTRWGMRPLSAEEIDRKEKSILEYPSQTAVMKRFLLSFARRSELFGDLEDPHAGRVADDAIRIDGNASEWDGMRPAFQDPVNDNLLRDFQAGGDVKAVYACRDSRNLYLRVDTYQPVSAKVRFRIRARYFGDPSRSESGGEFTADVNRTFASSPLDLRSAATENRLELAVPLRSLGYAHSLALDVETTIAGVQIDRTGYRFIDL